MKSALSPAAQARREEQRAFAAVLLKDLWTQDGNRLDPLTVLNPSHPRDPDHHFDSSGFAEALLLPTDVTGTLDPTHLRQLGTRFPRLVELDCRNHCLTGDVSCLFQESGVLPDTLQWLSLARREGAEGTFTADLTDMKLPRSLRWLSFSHCDFHGTITLCDATLRGLTSFYISPGNTGLRLLGDVTRAPQCLVWAEDVGAYSFVGRDDAMGLLGTTVHLVGSDGDGRIDDTTNGCWSLDGRAFSLLARAYCRGELSADFAREMMATSPDALPSSSDSIRSFMGCAGKAMVLQGDESDARAEIAHEWRLWVAQFKASQLF